MFIIGTFNATVMYLLYKLLIEKKKEETLKFSYFMYVLYVIVVEL